MTVLLLVGVAAAVFVGATIGGSSTGVAFGPAVCAGLLSKGTAVALIVGFVLLGGWTVAVFSPSAAAGVSFACFSLAG